MPKVDLARYQDHMGEENDLTPLVIGALKLLDDFAAAAANRAEATRLDGGRGDSEDLLLLAALGLLSLRQTSWRWASYAAGDHTVAPRQPPEPPPSSMLR